MHKKIIMLTLWLYICGCQKAHIQVPVEVSPGRVEFQENWEIKNFKMSSKIHVTLDVENSDKFRTYAEPLLKNICSEFQKSNCFSEIEISDEMRKITNFSEAFLVKSMEKAKKKYRYKFILGDSLNKDYVGSTAVAYLGFAYIAGLATVSVSVGGIAAFPTLFLDKWRAALGFSLDLYIYETIGSSEKIVFSKRYFLHDCLAVGIMCSEDYQAARKMEQLMRQQLCNKIYKDIELFYQKNE